MIVLSGELKERYQVVQKTQTIGGFGNPESSETALKTIRCKQLKFSSADKIQFGENELNKVVLLARLDDSFDTGDILVSSGRIKSRRLEIESIDYYREDNSMRIVAKALGNNGS